MKLYPIELAFMFLSNITYHFLHFGINFCFKICFQHVLNFWMSRGQRSRYQRNPPTKYERIYSPVKLEEVQIIAQLSLNATQINPEIISLLKQIQPPDQTNSERRLQCPFQFQLKQRLGLFSNKFSHQPTDLPTLCQTLWMSYLLTYLSTELGTTQLVII